MNPDLLLFDVPATGKKVTRRKSADLRRNKVDHELAKNRYYLHTQLDKTLFRIHGPKRLIYTDYDSFDAIPVGPRYYIKQLIDLGYNVQYKLKIQ